MSGTGREEYTFENYLVDDSNQFAAAVCRMVAQTPIYYINPVVVYGCNGCGKTHLLFAIAHDMKLRHPLKKVVITSAEEIMEKWFSEPKEYGDNDFEDRICEVFSDADVLLIDHFQFIARKPETADSFMRLFERRYVQQLQTMIVTDEESVGYRSFINRFRETFENGIVARVTMPGAELKRKYVKTVAEAQAFKLSPELTDFLSQLDFMPPAELRGIVIKALHYERVN